MKRRPKWSDYPFELRPLSTEEGGGYLISFPDLPGCMSDGETIDEAIANGQDAFSGWAQTHLDDDLPVPRRSESGLSGKWVQRVPKSIHAGLTRRAQAEGVSLNTLVLSMILEGFSNVWGERNAKAGIPSSARRAGSAVPGPHSHVTPQMASSARTASRSSAPPKGRR